MISGPSYCVDTACSSSMHALCLAYDAIKKNECEAAIVGGCNLCLNTGITAQLMKLGVLSSSGQARVLDEDGKYSENYNENGSGRYVPATGTVRGGLAVAKIPLQEMLWKKSTPKIITKIVALSKTFALRHNEGRAQRS